MMRAAVAAMITGRRPGFARLLAFIVRGGSGPRELVQIESVFHQSRPLLCRCLLSFGFVASQSAIRSDG
jgi:hypothetical protein